MKLLVIFPKKFIQFRRNSQFEMFRVKIFKQQRKISTARQSRGANKKRDFVYESSQFN